ncbi:MAG: hypothetical protein GX595_06585 [Lentisphaerae bacterium]|nr:hypothetical protein [Lentisphaerota bacterium]
MPGHTTPPRSSLWRPCRLPVWQAGTLLTLALAVSAQTAPVWQPPADAWLVFASATCEECEWLKTAFLPDLEARFAQGLPAVAFVDTDDIERNYPLLGEIEDALGSQGGDLPAVVIGARLFYGKDALAAWGAGLTDSLPRPALPEGVRAIAARAHGVSLYDGAAPVPAAQAAPAASAGGTATAAAPVVAAPMASAGGMVDSPEQATVLYFETTGCRKCARAEKQLLYALTRVSGARVARVNTLDPSGRALHYAVTGRLELPATQRRERGMRAWLLGLLSGRLELPSTQRLLTPMFVSGTRALSGSDITDSGLVELLASAPAVPFWQTWDAAAELASARRQLQRLAAGFTLLGVVGAALVDGVNPCAFAVIVFLVSYLTMTGRLGRRFALIYGLTFAAGVFLCYFVIGLGFFQLLDWLEAWKPAMRWIFLVMGLVCLGFGIGGVIDTLAARRGGAGQMKFGMPKALHRLVHRLIREDVSRGVLGLGALMIGVLVSGIELVCTGQIYLPVIMFINSSTPGLASIGMLTVYNLAFILPLVVVVLLSTAGLGSATLATWARRHAVLTRALTTLLVFALAAVMFVMAWRG